jgi:hypothetical protein
MSREAVNQIIDRAVADDAFFDLLRSNPDQAIQGYDLDAAEASAFRSGAYNVVVRGTRKDREEEAAWRAKREAPVMAAARPGPELAETPLQRQPKLPIAGLVGFFAGLLILGGGIGGFRYFEHQWPWQALGFGKAAAPGAIPAPSLGARAKPSASPARSAAASSAPSGSPASSGAASPQRSAAAASPSNRGTGQATLRPSPTAAPSSSASPADQSAADKAYFQAVGSRLATVLKTFSTTLNAIRGGSDPSTNLNDLTNAVSDLRQHLSDAPPPNQLRQQHQTLVQAVPLFQAGLDQLKSAIDQKNTVQQILVAAEMSALLEQVPDEVAFATAPHPELYQQIDSSQQLSHIQNFDVLSQNVTSRNSTPAAVTLRIGLQADNPSSDDVSDTLRHSIVAARQTYPQAGQIRVVAFKEVNGGIGNQLGSADWYCSPDARPPDAGGSSPSNWQDYCGKIYLSMPGSGSTNVTAVPY